MQTEEEFVWFLSASLQSFVQWQPQMFVSPGSSSRGYWEKGVLLLFPVLVPVSRSTAGMKIAQSTERTDWGFGVQIPSETSAILHVQVQISLQKYIV